MTDDVPEPPTWPFRGILKGQRIEVLRGGKPYRRGKVGETMPDGSGLWIEAEGALGRELLWNDEGFVIRRLSCSQSLHRGSD